MECLLGVKQPLSSVTLGRENMADYNADFLTMLETWDAAFAFWPSRDATSTQPIEIADFLAGYRIGRMVGCR